jgi:hypothetical protein
MSRSAPGFTSGCDSTTRQNSASRSLSSTTPRSRGGRLVVPLGLLALVAFQVVVLLVARLLAAAVVRLVVQDEDVLDEEGGGPGVGVCRGRGVRVVKPSLAAAPAGMRRPPTPGARADRHGQGAYTAATTKEAGMRTLAEVCGSAVAFPPGGRFTWTGSARRARRWRP